MILCPTPPFKIFKYHVTIRKDKFIHLCHSFAYRLNMLSTVRNVFTTCNLDTHKKQIIEIPIVCKLEYRKHFCTVIGYLNKQHFSWVHQRKCFEIPVFCHLIIATSSLDASDLQYSLSCMISATVAIINFWAEFYYFLLILCFISIKIYRHKHLFDFYIIGELVICLLPNM